MTATSPQTAADTGSHARATSLLRVDSVAKAFGPTRALNDCSLDLRPGEIHAIMGENGSGKSTLVKLLTGVHRPDRGDLTIGTRTVSGLRSPRAALDLGIAAVLQEILVAPPRSVLDNVWLGYDGLLRDRSSRRHKQDRAHAALAELLEQPPALDRPAEDLSISDRQACCIARALVRDPAVLILDEATSALDVATRDRLFAILRRLTGDGVGVLFISHRMDEVEEIADRVTVLRSGDSVATLPRGTTARELVSLMTGQDNLVGQTERRAAGERGADAVLRASHVQLRPGAAPFDFTLRAGEIVGVAGLEGHGQDAFLHVLRGVRLPGVALFAMKAGEQPAAIRSPRDARDQGIAYLPRERRAEALFETQPTLENFALPTVAADRQGMLVSKRRSARRLRGYVDRLSIKAGDVGNPITTLSGGNQQKIVLARWLAAKPRVLVLNDPTRGVDLGAKRDIYALLADLAADGVAMVMLSTELDEHVELMDRVLVFRDFELSAELSVDEVSRDALVARFFGQEVGGGG
jgi:ABC-type sugar transport system ATPase subunit